VSRTARWGGSGERDGEEYARNRCHYALQSINRLKPGGYGPGAVRPDVCRSGGNLRAGGIALAWGGHGEGLRRSRGEAAGAEPGSYSDKRITVNTGTAWCRFPERAGIQSGFEDRRADR
jgi:hypothetical protein